MENSEIQHLKDFYHYIETVVEERGLVLSEAGKEKMNKTRDVLLNNNKNNDCSHPEVELIYHKDGNVQCGRCWKYLNH